MDYSTELNGNSTFTPEDFGLTEEDVANYLARRRERQAQVESDEYISLSTELQMQLDALRDADAPLSLLSAEGQQALQALEAAMLHNLNVAVRAYRLSLIR